MPGKREKFYTKFPPQKEGSKKVNKKEKTLEPANAGKNLDSAGLNVYAPFFFFFFFLLIFYCDSLRGSSRQGFGGFGRRKNEQQTRKENCTDGKQKGWINLKKKRKENL